MKNEPDIFQELTSLIAEYTEEGILSLPKAHDLDYKLMQLKSYVKKLQQDNLASFRERQLVEDEVELHREFAKDIATNWDHDPDAHKHGYHCFVCMAQRLLDGRDPWERDKEDNHE